jgi:GAF domain-containing protein
VIEAAKPENEDARLLALARYKVLDTAPEQGYDDLTMIAANVCKTPIALISLIDEKRQWFKSRVGLEDSETPRWQAFCSHAILDDRTFVVPDTKLDSRFHDNPLVTGAPGIRFYAGHPIQTHDGFRLGTICVIDTEPRSISTAVRGILPALARQVGLLLQWRMISHELVQALEVLDTPDASPERLNGAMQDVRKLVGGFDEVSEPGGASRLD